MPKNIEPFEIRSQSVRRILRVGSCPVLDVRVTYPCLSIPEGEGEGSTAAVHRFNEAYREMAEGVLAWAEGDPAASARAAFFAEGEGAAYRFARYVLTCAMTAAPADAERGEGELWVTRVLSLRVGRGEEMALSEERDVWRLPALTLRAGRRKNLPFLRGKNE